MVTVDLLGDLVVSVSSPTRLCSLVSEHHAFHELTGHVSPVNRGFQKCPGNIGTSMYLRLFVGEPRARAFLILPHVGRYYHNLGRDIRTCCRSC